MKETIRTPSFENTEQAEDYGKTASEEEYKSLCVERDVLIETFRRMDQPETEYCGDDILKIAFRQQWVNEAIREYLKTSMKKTILELLHHGLLNTHGVEITVMEFLKEIGGN